MEYKEWTESDEYKHMFCIADDIQKFKGTDQALNFIIKTAYNAGKRLNKVIENDPAKIEVCKKCGESGPVYHCEQCGYNWTVV